LDRRLGELQSRSGRGGEEKNSHTLPGLRIILAVVILLLFILLKCVFKSSVTLNVNFSGAIVAHASYVLKTAMMVPLSTGK
jgi:hypothetical protein